jgi:hypothetical protein
MPDAPFTEGDVEGSKGAFVMICAYWFNCTDFDEVYTALSQPGTFMPEDEPYGNETQNALRNFIEYTHEQMQKEKPWIITADFIYTLGFRFSMFRTMNSFYHTVRWLRSISGIFQYPPQMKRGKKHDEHIKRNRRKISPLIILGNNGFTAVPAISAARLLGAWKQPRFDGDVIRRYISISDNTRILDLACGKGVVTVKVAQKLRVKVKGVDLMPEFIEYAMKKAKEFDVEGFCEFALGDINEAVKTEKENGFHFLWTKRLIMKFGEKVREQTWIFTNLIVPN